MSNWSVDLVCGDNIPTGYDGTKVGWHKLYLGTDIDFLMGALDYFLWLVQKMRKSGAL